MNTLISRDFYERECRREGERLQAQADALRRLLECGSKTIRFIRSERSVAERHKAFWRRWFAAIERAR